MRNPAQNLHSTLCSGRQAFADGSVRQTGGGSPAQEGGRLGGASLDQLHAQVSIRQEVSGDEARKENQCGGESG